MMVVKGSQCVLREQGVDGNIDEVGLHFPPDYVVCHDASGEYLGANDFYICRFGRAEIPEDRITEEDVRAAERFYGNQQKIVLGDVELPDGAWQRVCLIDAIGYRRRGDRSGSYKHEYAEPVPLFECKGKTRAWRLRLPVNFVADERGFVLP